MDNAIIVSNDDKGLIPLSDIVKSCGLSNISIVKNTNEARRYIIENDVSLIIVNTPLINEFGTSFALDATQTNAGIIIIVRAEMVNEISYKVENEGILVIGKPLQKSILIQAIKMGIATHNRILGVRKENKSLQKKIEEMRTIDRAKCLLIQCLSMSEAQAHRFIEKQAMDMRISRKEIAEGIIRTYET